MPNRSILKNVLDIDYAAMTTALTTNNGALVLFDFASAFPSISQDYMFNLLAATGVPLNALNMIRAHTTTTGAQYKVTACKCAVSP